MGKKIGHAWRDIVELISQHSVPDSPPYLKVVLDDDLDAVVNEAMALLKRQKKKLASLGRANKAEKGI